MRMPDVQGAAEQLADDLWVIDTRFQGERGIIASYLLTGSGGLALVDVGSAATIEQLLAGVRTAGCDPAAIEHLVITHVHLDHAGAAGALTRVLPRARVYVHRIGAPHLIDPSRLLSSAERIYKERMIPLWGTILPVPEERMVVVDDGDQIQVGERTLRVIYTPGHAVHHVALHDARRAEAFTGDVAGVRLEGSRFVRPPTPPPDLSLEDWYASIHRLAALDLGAIYLPHFGAVSDVMPHLAQLRERLADWGRVILAGMRRGETDEQLAADLAAHADDAVAHSMDEPRDAALRRYELAANYLMSAQGYVRYYRKHHPELL
jgi:glyoxylase-like metal-dependent hydrolase (beta-lactamase superfamily II)